MSLRTVKQYQNSNGVVMFIDDRKSSESIVSYIDISGNVIEKDDKRALNFFNNGPYLVMEIE